MGNMDKAKVLSYSTGTLLTLVGLGAVATGLGLMLEPTGEGLGFSLSLLKDSPFDDYLIPGILLFSIHGIASLIGALLAFRNNRFTGIATMLLGISMVIWIVAQVVWIGSQSWLQPTFLVVGCVELALGILIIDQHIERGIFFGHHHTHVH